MAHQIETMAYTNEQPWHGLGFRVADAPNVDEMLRLAKLDWRVERREMQLMNGAPVKGFAALVRDSDEALLDVVGPQYQPAQNKEVFEFFREFVNEGKATMETAGSLRGGRMVWGLANLKAGFKMPGDDKVNGYLLAASPHEQGKSLVFKFTTVRVVCNNTLSLALSRKSKNEHRVSHRREFDLTSVQAAKEALGIAREQMGEFEVNARKLQKLNLSRADVIRILAPVYQPKAKAEELISDFSKATPKMQRVMDILDNAPGAQPDNAWGVLNAVTYYSDHVASRTADKRLTNAWFGKTANVKEAVLDKLLEMA